MKDLPPLFTDNVKRSTRQFNTLFKTGKCTNEIIKAVCQEHMFSHLIINHVNKMINSMDHSSKNFFFNFDKKTAMNANIDSQNKYFLFLSFISVFIFPHIKVIQKLLLSDHIVLNYS